MEEKATINPHESDKNPRPLIQARKYWLRLLLTVIMVSLVSTLALVAFQFLISNIVLASKGALFNGFSGLFLAFFVGYFISLFAYFLTGGFLILLLRYVKFPHALPIGLFTGVTLIASNHIIGALSNIFEVQIPMVSYYFAAAIVIFLLLLLYWTLFSIRSLRLYWSTSIAVSIVILCFYLLPKYGMDIQNNQFRMKQTTKLASANIDFYVTKKTVGQFDMTGFESNYYSNPQYGTLLYKPTIRVNEFVTPPDYNPPQNCGYKTPSNLFRNSPPISCKYLGTTSNGRAVYGFSQYYAEYFKERPEYKEAPEVYFTKINNTVISLESIPPYITTDEIMAFIEALEPISLDELQTLNKSVQENFKNARNNQSQFVTYKVYIPQYIPDNMSLKGYSLDNVQDPTYPNLTIQFDRAAVREWKPRIPFSPPENCGTQDAESEAHVRYPLFGYECELLLTTNKGLNIYRAQVRSGYYFLLGETKIVMTFLSPISSNELSKFVDSFVETPISNIEMSNIQ